MEEALWLCEGLQKQHGSLEGWPMLEDALATGQEWPQRRRAIAHAQQGLGCSGSNDHHGSVRAFISRRESLNPQGKLRIWQHCAYVELLHRVRLFATPWTVGLQPLPFMGFSRQEYWGRLPFPPPGDLPNPGIKLTSPVSPALVGRFFSTEPPGKLIGTLLKYLNFFKFKCKHLCFPCSSVPLIIIVSFLKHGG